MDNLDNSMNSNNMNDSKSKIKKEEKIEPEKIIIKVKAPKFAFVGQKIPNFSLISWSKNNFKVVNNKDYKGKYLIMKFFRYNFNQITADEYIELNSRFSEILALSKWKFILN